MDPRLIPELEQVLKTLANASRLHLLIALQQPKRLVDIRLESDGRPISRQAVQKHLGAMEDVGLVQRGDDGMYVVRHPRIYEIVERLRTLATIRAAVALDDVTRELADDMAPIRPDHPHLVTIRGVAEGSTYVLDAPDEDGGWTLGRKGELRLDHDQFISGRHARIIIRDGEHFLLDLASNRNGTTLNWRPMERGGLASLQAGDIIGIGMTRLVFRPGRTVSDPRRTVETTA